MRFAATRNFLECTKEVDADFIISSDDHLVRLGEFEGIKIMSASRFIKEGVV